MGLGSNGYTERLKHPSKELQDSPRSKELQHPLPWRLYKGSAKSWQNQRPKWARGRPAGLATAAIGQTQLSTDSREGSEPLSESRRQRGGNPRPAGLRPAGPTWRPLRLRFGVEVKRNEITCFQPTLPAVTSRTDPGRAMKGATIHHFNTHHWSSSLPLVLFRVD